MVSFSYTYNILETSFFQLYLVDLYIYKDVGDPPVMPREKSCILEATPVSFHKNDAFHLFLFVFRLGFRFLCCHYFNL